MTQISKISVTEITPGPNDRTTFRPAGLAELADSIREHGLLQPITVRQMDAQDLYEIVAGERRYRACRYNLGWAEVPCIIIDATEEEASAMMLAENVSRQDLDAIDEAAAYQARMTRFDWTVSEIAKRAGVSEIRVRFRLKLLDLTSDIQELVSKGHLTLGYAQILSDGKLDSNRQRMAISKLRDNPKATPGWFRRIVNELFTEQAQGQLFEMPMFGGEYIAQEIVQVADPPLPTTTRPPVRGSSPIEVVKNQIGFWEMAALEWQNLGKPFKRQECQSAMAALQFAAEVIA